MTKIKLVELVADNNYTPRYKFLNSEDKNKLIQKGNLEIDFSGYSTNTNNVHVKYNLRNALDNVGTRMSNLEIIPLNYDGIDKLERDIFQTERDVKNLDFLEAHKFWKKKYWDLKNIGKKKGHGQALFFDSIVVGSAVGGFFFSPLFAFTIAGLGGEGLFFIGKGAQKDHLKEHNKYLENYKIAAENIDNAKVNVNYNKEAQGFIKACKTFELPKDLQNIKGLDKEVVLPLDNINNHLVEIYKRETEEKRFKKPPF